jgi:hypothetical protein
MKHSRKSREMDERVARFDAEDRALVYLDKFPPPVARKIAINVEWSLATKCAAIQSEMRRQRDPSEVVEINLNDFQKLIEAIAATPPDIQSDAAAEQKIIDLLADFPPDWAWWIAHNVANWAVYFASTKHVQ